MKKQEKKSTLLTLSAIVLLSTLSLLTSCQQADIVLEQTGRYTIESHIELNDAWQNITDVPPKGVASRAEDNALRFYIYIFGSNSTAIINGYNLMTATPKSVTFPSQVSTTGTYTLYGITNIVSGEQPSMSGTPTPVVNTSSTFTLNAESAPNDVCLGSSQVTVTASQYAYSSTITVSHIMSKLALTVKSVPSDITSMTVTLPNQANVFDFTGAFSGNTTSQTLTLTKAATANTDGTYNWTCPATIVFPCATGTTSMPIKITWGSTTVTSKDVNTTSSTCCLSGKNLSLSTTWNEYFRLSGTIATANWSTVESASFDW